MRLRRFWAGLAVLALSTLLAGTMWVVPYLPTNDGPEWAFGSHVENHYGEPGTVYADFFVPSLQFAARGVTPVLTFAEDWLGWERGISFSLTIVVLLTAFGFLALVRELDPRRWPLGFLGFPLALSWELYMGMWSFAVSTALGLFVLALAVRLREPGWKERALLSVALLVTAVAHVFGAVLTGGAVLLLSVARVPQGRRWGEAGRVSLVGLPAAAVLAASAVVTRDLPVNSLTSGLERLPWAEVLATLPRTIAPGPLSRALLVTLGVVAAAVLGAVRAFKPTTPGADRGLGVAAVLLLLLGVFAPFQIPGWQGFSERFIPLGVSLAIAVVPLERLGPRALRLAPPLLFTIAAAWLGLSYPFHRRLAALCPDAIAGLTANVQLTGAILPVVIRGTELPVYDRISAEVPLLSPLRHMGTLYAVAHGGVPVPTFTGNAAIHAFIGRPDAPARAMPDAEHYLRAMSSLAYHRDLAYRREIDGELASFGFAYDETVVLGALPEDLEVWHERGFVADFEQGATLVAHFEPCTLDVRVPAPLSNPAPAFDIRVGKFDLIHGARTTGALAADGFAHFELTRAPCGVVGVRPRWEASAGGPSPRCSNATADGELIARVTRTEHRVTCDAP